MSKALFMDIVLLFSAIGLYAYTGSPHSFWLLLGWFGTGGYSDKGRKEE